ncbi:hypothetical protein EON81_17690 [bacterium]|nr:MAG: hypothetical protein EON81_17690 [bacterium]
MSDQPSDDSRGYSPSEAVADLLGDLGRGAFTILIEAIRQGGGELRFDYGSFLTEAYKPWMRIEVSDAGSEVVLTLRPID